MPSKKIINIIVSRYKPEKIILFGSQIKGGADKYSDFDFIIVKKTNDSFIRRLANFPYLPISADIFIYTPQEFKKMQKDESIFLSNALKESKIIYEKSKGRG
ncbi:nucleotidyltransferase domain-containing protein [Patescibacteria group bacterium]|nr:nucleotidyltransferase domain-containing protein [Patescibacteria group bacterium]